MDPSAFICSCGRLFLVDFAFAKHQRSCASSKKRLSSALDSAKIAWHARKKRKLTGETTAVLPFHAGLRREIRDVHEFTFTQVSQFDVIHRWKCKPDIIRNIAKTLPVLSQTIGISLLRFHLMPTILGQTPLFLHEPSMSS